MARHVLLVMTNCAEGEDAEFNRWYDEVHLPEVLSVPGFVGATRYRIDDVQMPWEPPGTHRYLAIYEIDADEPQAALDEFNRRARDFQFSPTLIQGRGAVRTQLFTPLG